MGNSVAVASEPLSVAALLERHHAPSTGPMQMSYTATLHAWECKERHAAGLVECVAFRTVRNLTSRSCYVIVSVRCKGGKQPAATSLNYLRTSDAVAAVAEKSSLARLLGSARQNMSPRGLNSLWRRTVDYKADGVAYEFCSYVWCGSKASNEACAFALAQMERLVGAVEASPALLVPMFRAGNTPLSDYMAMDADLDDLSRVNHLVRRLQGGSRRKELRDATYSLFGRPELVKERKKIAAGSRSSRGLRGNRNVGGAGGHHGPAASNAARHSSSSSSSSSSASSSDSSDSEDSNADESSEEDERDERPKPKLSARRELVEPDMSLNGDEFSGGLLGAFNPNDDGGDEPDPNEPEPEDDAGHGQRIRFYDLRISEITPQLFLGSATGARKRKWLQKRGITHVLNCASMILKNWWPDDFNYLSLYLLDGKREDVLSLVYHVLEWIDNAINSGGKVFIHCQQGVSRSTTMLELYLMWKWRQSYRDVNAKVKAARNVASPNAGFIVQLMMWEKRLAPLVKARLYLMAPQSTYDPDFIVPKLTTIKTPMTLMSNEVYVLHSQQRLWVWIGKASPESHREGAMRVLPLMVKFERAPTDHRVAQEGEEPDMLWKDLYGDSGSPRTSIGPPSAAPLQSPPSAGMSRTSFGAGPSQAAARTAPTALPALKLGAVPPPAQSAEPKRPASPVKLKLNLGIVKTGGDMAKKSTAEVKVVKPLALPARSAAPALRKSTSGGALALSSSGSVTESSSSSDSDDDDPTSSTTEEDERDGGAEAPDAGTDDAEPPARSPAKRPVALRLGDMSQPPVSPHSQGALSPLSSPSLRHRLGLPVPVSPKTKVSTANAQSALSLEQARKALDLNNTKLVKRLSGPLLAANGSEVAGAASNTGSGHNSSLEQLPNSATSKRASMAADAGKPVVPRGMSTMSRTSGSPENVPEMRLSLGALGSSSPESVSTPEKRLSLGSSHNSPSPEPATPEKRLSLGSHSGSSSERDTSSRVSPHVVLPPLALPEVESLAGEHHIVRVLSHLYLSDERGVADAAFLKELGVVDVINVAGAATSATALSLNMTKSGSVSPVHYKTKTFFCDGDVLCLLHLILPRMREAQTMNKPLLVHDDAAVLRGAAQAFAVAFLMWEYRQPLVACERALVQRGGEMLQEAMRAQLLVWEERLNGTFSDAARVYIVSKQSVKAPTLLVPKLVPRASRAVLKPDNVVIIVTPAHFWIWTGRTHKFNVLASAKKICQQMDEMELHGRMTVEVVAQGKEPSFLFKKLSAE